MNMTPVQEVSYSVKRTARKKTASIEIVNGDVTVVVPSHLSDAQVSRLVMSRRDRINKTIDQQRRVSRKTAIEYVSGQGLQYLGRTYRLKVFRKGVGVTGLRNGRLEVWTAGSMRQGDHVIRDELVTWYKKRAEQTFQERLKIYGETVGVNISSLRMRDMKTKWGSCTKDGKVTLNWRLIFAPKKVLDYVIVHELCHLLCHDHSRRFWSKVMRVLPDYEVSRQWLRDHGHKLTL